MFIIYSVLPSQSNGGDIEQPIKQLTNPRKSTGPRLGRCGQVSYGRCVLCVKRADEETLSDRSAPAKLPTPGSTGLGRRGPAPPHEAPPLPARPRPAPPLEAITLATQSSAFLHSRHFPFGIRHRLATGCGFPGKAFLGIVVWCGGRSRAGYGWGRGARPRRTLLLHAGLGSAMENGGRPSLVQFILLGSSSVVTAVLYSVYRQKARDAQELKVSAGPDLASAGSALPPAMVGTQFALGRSTVGALPKRGNRLREGVTRWRNWDQNSGLVLIASWGFF